MIDHVVDIASTSALEAQTLADLISSLVVNGQEAGHYYENCLDLSTNIEEKDKCIVYYLGKYSD